MIKSFNRDKLREAILADRFEWSKHALQRLVEREITQDAALQVLIEGEMIADYPDDKPYQSALFLGWADNQALHIVAALDAQNEWVYIITAYVPDEDHFNHNFRIRRR